MKIKLSKEETEKLAQIIEYKTLIEMYKPYASYGIEGLYHICYHVLFNTVEYPELMRIDDPSFRSYVELYSDQLRRISSKNREDVADFIYHCIYEKYMEK